MDEKGDYTFGRKDFLTGTEAVAQAILTRLRLLYAEWWENTDDGLPLFENSSSGVKGPGILGRRGDKDNIRVVDLLFSQRIQGTTGVTSITGYESSFDANTRNYQASCIVDTIYGTQEISVKTVGSAIEFSSVSRDQGVMC